MVLTVTRKFLRALKSAKVGTLLRVGPNNPFARGTATIQVLMTEPGIVYLMIKESGVYEKSHTVVLSVHVRSRGIQFPKKQFMSEELLRILGVEGIETPSDISEFETELQFRGFLEPIGMSDILD